jgi:hypothetical protein
MADLSPPSPSESAISDIAAPVVGEPAAPANAATDQAPARNSVAVAAAVLGVLGAIPFAIAFGIAGLVRAARVGRGKGLAWLGIVLGVLWVIPAVYVVQGLHVAPDAGCQAAKDTVVTGASTLQRDAADPAKGRTDLTAIANGLAAAADQSSDSDVKAALGSLAGDYRTMVKIMDGGDPSGVGADLLTDTKRVEQVCHFS